MTLRKKAKSLRWWCEINLTDPVCWPHLWCWQSDYYFHFWHITYDPNLMQVVVLVCSSCFWSAPRTNIGCRWVSQRVDDAAAHSLITVLSATITRTWSHPVSSASLIGSSRKSFFIWLFYSIFASLNKRWWQLRISTVTGWVRSFYCEFRS